VSAPPDETAASGRLSRALAWVVTRLSLAIVVAWIAGAAVMSFALPALGGGEPLVNIDAQDSPAAATERASAEHFRIPVLSRSMVVQRDPSGLSEEAQQRLVSRAGEVRLDGLDGLRGALPLLNVRAVLPRLPEDRTTAVTFLLNTPDTSLQGQDDNAHGYADRVVNHPDDAFAGVAGTAPARVAQWDEIADALPLVTIASIALILLVVGLRFRALLAPLVALGAAGIAYLVAIHLIGWLDERFDLSVPQEAEPVMVVLLLGVVTDYAIFYLDATRSRLADGCSRVEAAQQAARSTTPIVATAGILVAASTATLLLGRSDFFRAFGPGLAITALVAALVAVTFVPALLSLLGRVTYWPHGTGRAEPSVAEAREGWRFRVARVLTARPAALLLAVGCTALLLVAASGLKDLRLGFPVTADLPAGAGPARAAHAATQGFGPGIVAPTEVLVQLPRAEQQLPGLQRLATEIHKRDHIAGVIAPVPNPQLPRGALISPDGQAARMVVLLDVDPLSGAGVDAVRDLREALPALARDAGLKDARTGVAGDAALAADTIDGMLGDLLRVAIASLLVTFLVLALFLRSLLAPLVLMCASVLALAAGMGLTVYVFRELAGYDDLTWYVPFTAGVLLIALGADYNVFVTGRVWQAAHGRSLRDAIALAAPRSARALVIAGLTLALSFAALAIVPLRSFRELAFALAVGVLLETFLVRSVLVPSLLSLLRPRVRAAAAPQPVADA
jgi:RND superfamily putative drug exporter